MAIDQAQAQQYAKQWGQLVARAWSDEAFKARLLAEPGPALAEQGIEVPPGINVQVHENTPTLVHLTLPPPPDEELSDEQLDVVAGGGLHVSTVSSLGSLSCPTSTIGTAGTTACGG